MSQQIGIDVLLSLLSDANKKNALLEIDIAKLKSQTDTHCPELESYESKIAALSENLNQTKNDLDVANKKIASYVEIYKLNENKLSSLESAFNKFYLIPISLELLPHEQHIEKVERIMYKKKFKKLLRYGSFKLDKIYLSCIEKCDDVVLKHIIDNCKNLNGSVSGKNGIKFFSRVISYRENNFEIVKYLIKEKNVNLEEEYSNKSTPIYFACQNSSFEVINLILDQNVKLGFKNTDNKTQSYYLEKNAELTDDQKKIIEDRIQSIIKSRIAPE